MRLHRDAPRRGSLPDRDRHRLRPARLRLDPLPRSRRRLGRRRGRHGALRLPRPLGPGARAISSAAHGRRSRERRLPLHARAGAQPSASSPAWRARVTYVGELGWELYCPTEFGRRLWDTLWESGAGHGLLAGGYKAIDSLRLEKGYRVWGADITPDETPYEAGLGFAVKLDKGDFLGRDALVAAQEPLSGAKARLPRPRRSTRGRSGLRAGPYGRRCPGTGDERGLRLLGRALDRVRLRARRRGRGRADAWRSRSSATGYRRRSLTSRSGIRRASGFAPSEGLGDRHSAKPS